MRLVAIFGPTGVGKTEVAIELAEILRDRGEDPVAVSCDSIAVYRGLETLSAAPGREERRRLEHRLVGFLDPAEEFSAGRFAELARGEIDSLLAAGRRPLLVGGTGLYMRMALTDLEPRPPVDPELRAAVEAEIADRGPQAAWEQLPEDVAARVHPNDRKRIARSLELLRSGQDPPERLDGLWTASLRHPALLIGLVAAREQLDRSIDERVERMLAAGAPEEAERAAAAGASRTARAALGFEELLAGDLDAMKRAHRRLARRQVTWLRRMDGIEVLERDRRSSSELAAEIAARLG